MMQEGSNSSWSDINNQHMINATVTTDQNVNIDITEHETLVSTVTTAANYYFSLRER